MEESANGPCLMGGGGVLEQSRWAMGGMHSTFRAAGLGQAKNRKDIWDCHTYGAGEFPTYSRALPHSKAKKCYTLICDLGGLGGVG